MKAVAVRTAIAVLGGFCLTVSPSAAQQPYPSRSIEIIVPFAAGGTTDVTFRLIGPPLAKRLGQRVIILNKPGAGASLGMSEVARAAPDGHTLGAASFTFAVNTAVLDKMAYDPEKDFEPVTMVSRTPVMVLVNPKTPVTTVQEFIDWAKTKPPGELNYGSAGTASSGHLMSELFTWRAGLKMVHIPYTRGAAAALAQGETHLQLSPTATAAPWIADGRLRAIALTTLEPDPGLPDLPPVSRTVPGFDTYEWSGLVVPARTPRTIIDRIQREIAEIVAEPEIKERLAAIGSQPVASTPEQFAAFIKKERVLWADVARQRGGRLGASQ